MISVYKINPDTSCQRLLADDTSLLMEFPFDGTAIADIWEPIDLWIYNPLAKEPDFFWLSPGVFVMRPETLRMIVTFIDESCETLPVKLDDQELLPVNVINVENCLDKKKTVYKLDMPDAKIIGKYAFLPNRNSYSLFKIPETRKAEIYCIEGRAAACDEFKGVVESLGLTGLTFQRVWSE